MELRKKVLMVVATGAMVGAFGLSGLVGGAPADTGVTERSEDVALSVRGKLASDNAVELGNDVAISVRGVALSVRGAGKALA